MMNKLWRFFWEYWEAIRVAFAFCLAVLLVCFIVFFAFTKVRESEIQACKELGEMMEKPTRFTNNYGCVIQEQGRWIPLSVYRFEAKP